MFRTIYDHLKIQNKFGYSSKFTDVNFESFLSANFVLLLYLTNNFSPKIVGQYNVLFGPTCS
jgi:hypothetical protein